MSLPLILTSLPAYSNNRYISLLQCVAVCCSVLQCVAVWCNVVQCVADSTQQLPNEYAAGICESVGHSMYHSLTRV